MKRSIVLLLVLTVALALVAVPVSAGPPTTASGAWDYVLTGPPEVKVAGPNVFIYGQDHGEWLGTFTGSTEEEFVVICHPNAGMAFYKGEMTFTGTVEDESGTPQEGTMVIKTNAKQATDTCDPSPAIWHGHWVILGGTEGLVNVHGQGTFYGASLHAEYEGQIHFD
jgi:hypothetical protein